MTPRLSFQVLGPLKVSVDGRPLLLRSARQRTVLAVLLLTPGRAVSVDALADAVWHSDPPATARNQIAICVSALRKTFRDEAGVSGLIETLLPGYVLHREGHYVDVADLYESAAAARSAVEAGDASEAAARFEDALALWSGPVLDGLDGSALSGTVGRISELRIDLAEEYAAVQLQQGRYRSVVESLGPVVAEHPLREHARAVLMQAYHLSGRRSEALDCYREGRRVLVEELGVEPGAELRELHRTVLAGDGRALMRAAVVPDAVAPDTASSAVLDLVPRQLPLPPEPFVGREGELELLRRIVPPGPGYSGGPTAGVAAICGPAGVGKSALALHWADRVAGRFPDGQLYLDLQAHGRGCPGTPQAALDRALRALGVPGTSIPESLEDRAALYRGILDGRRLLVVLDNARSVEQIRPLLPGRGSVRAVVTSRDPLHGLAGTLAVARVELGAMSAAESLDLLAATIGEHRVTAEPVAAERLVDLCDRLPLALRVVATRLLSDHRWSLGQMAARMEDRRERIGVLNPGESGLRSGVWLGYRALSVQAARFYRQLSMLEVPDVPAWIGAPVLGVTPAASEELLHQLVKAQLLEARPAHGGGTRFRFQDPLRLFARERCLAEDSPQERDQVLERVMAAVLTLVYAAQEQLYGRGEAPQESPAYIEPVPGETVSELVADPIEWFEGERETLGALVAQAVRDGQAGRAWLLVVGTVPFYETRNYLEDWRRTAECALEGARRAGHTRGAGTMLRSLGTLAIYQRRYEEARERLLTALVHLERTDDTQGRAIARRNLAVCARFFGDIAEAARYCEESLVLFRRAGDYSGLSHALGLLAQMEIEQGNPERGVELSNQAIEVSYEAGSLRSRTQNLYRLAEALLGTGRSAQAERICHDVVGLARGQGDRLGEAHGLCALGEAQWRQNEPHRARASLLRALRLAEEVGDRFLQARIIIHLACAEAIRGTAGAGEPLDWAQEEFRTFNATMWARRAGRLREVLESHDTVRPIEGSVLVCLLADG
ncbi:BTAD domain-containing putative transcriptional regulator [Streptomyces sp. C11-1]|uniref:BTAD domain-containing putative transcriptional regulator n=1 Tax=Streptomyces durocortorensis TaxID=2811104 RepID=A0ABY9W1K2_9ACTN|nr:BTAD domain-containing putative transcriptional regulator [Streptomyces durocortorensis]WNF29339.1 BTAD domain-containing putative transcriptional regulator [Streptomyces durocortorensis]